MAGYGYSHVNEKGFIAFRTELDGGAWQSISVDGFDQESSMAKAPLRDAPASVVWKLRALWGIRALMAAVGADALATLDMEWDSAQRALNLAVALAEEAKQPEVRAAAGRVKVALLGGGGSNQTQLSYDQEVDYGAQQLELAQQTALAEDVTIVGISAHLQRIGEATAALAKGLGRDEGKARSPSRSRRVRDAVAVCSTAFNGIHEEIAWAIEHTADLEQRADLQALLNPFQQLLDRYPPAAPGAKPPAEEPADPSAPPA